MVARLTSCRYIMILNNAQNFIFIKPIVSRLVKSLSKIFPQFRILGHMEPTHGCSNIILNTYLIFRYEINALPLHQKSKDSDCEQSEAACIATSTKVTDLRIGVASFCKAFPWHFVTDKRLELVQLGKFSYFKYRMFIFENCFNKKSVLKILLFCLNIF